MTPFFLSLPMADQHTNHTSGSPESGGKETGGEGTSAAEQSHHSRKGTQPPPAGPRDAQAKGH